MAAKSKSHSKKSAAKAVGKAVDSARVFEKLLKQAAGGSHYSLRLYITGNTARSGEAIANIRSLCEEFLAGNYDLEVIDIFQHPNAAAGEQIIAAPTLIKTLPMPPKRLIGNLSDRDKVIVGLNLQSSPAPASKSGKTHWIKV
jgi:circadian clock protein KaiB